MTASRRVRTTVLLAIGRLAQCYEDMRDHPQLAALYPEYLILSHMIVRASVPLLDEARARAFALGGPLGDALGTYLARHVTAEQDHDEWALDDLAELGFTRDDVLSRMPPASVAAMVGAQYYWVRHHHPVAVLGYIAILEGYPPPPEEIKEIASRSGLPRSSFSTWARHAELDPGHSRELDALLDSLPLTGSDLACVCTSALGTIRFSTAVFGELLQRYPVGESVIERAGPHLPDRSPRSARAASG